MPTQTVLIPRDVPIGQAIRWLHNHNFTAEKVDYTTNYMRFRQIEPIEGAHYYSVHLPNGFILVEEKA